jgi:hypothetical protein
LSIGRPLQWFSCQLHANELPLRRLITYLDGPTSGPKAFSGDIGKLLPTVEHMEVVDFAAINSNVPAIFKSDLSTDQRYLYDMCRAVHIGQCSESLSDRSPGVMVHSRWLTTANRILRLYISTSNPSVQLVTLTTFVLKVYAPMWFAIKTNPSCTAGAKHLFKTIELTRYLPKDQRDLIDVVIQKNGFFGHVENILISMLDDHRRSIRKIAVTRIIAARQNQPENVRKFTVPRFKFDAKDYATMIQWNNVTEPPLLAELTNNQLWEIVDDPAHHLNEIRSYPCHTQAVERHVKLVTEASLAFSSMDRRNGSIRAKIQSRSKLPKFDTKKDYRF